MQAKGVMRRFSRPHLASSIGLPVRLALLSLFGMCWNVVLFSLVFNGFTVFSTVKFRTTDEASPGSLATTRPPAIWNMVLSRSACHGQTAPLGFFLGPHWLLVKFFLQSCEIFHRGFSETIVLATSFMTTFHLVTQRSPLREITWLEFRAFEVVALAG